jgi:hypothetical protein
MEVKELNLLKNKYKTDKERDTTKADGMMVGDGEKSGKA